MQGREGYIGTENVDPRIVRGFAFGNDNSGFYFTNHPTPATGGFSIRHDEPPILPTGPPFRSVEIPHAFRMKPDPFHPNFDSCAYPNMDIEKSAQPNPKTASKFSFGLGGMSAPKTRVKTRAWCLFNLYSSIQFTKSIIIVGYRLHQLYWSPSTPPTLDATTGFIFLDCPQLSHPFSLLSNVQRSIIASWQLSGNTGPNSIAKFKDVMLNEPVELNRLDFTLFNGSGTAITITSSNGVYLALEFLLPN
jgi:hypothetical protein